MAYSTNIMVDIETGGTVPGSAMFLSRSRECPAPLKLAQGKITRSHVCQMALW